MRDEVLEATKFKTKRRMVDDMEVIEDPAPETMTLKEAADWNNNLRKFAPFEEDEERFVTEQFVVMVSAIAEREGILPGLAAYIIDELSFTLRIPLPGQVP